MALYDDLDTKQGPDKVAGWSSGIKLLQTQLQAKKATQPIIPPKNVLRKHALTPVVNLKAKKENVDLFGTPSGSNQAVADKPVTITTTSIPTVSSSAGDAYSWDVIDEYNPLWPNEYEKLTKDRKPKEPPKQPVNNYGGGRHNKREYKRGINLSKIHGGGGGGGAGGGGPGLGAGGGDDDGPSSKKSGFAGRPSSDDEEEFRPGLKSSAGATIAPPASLQESVAQIPDGSKMANLTAYGGSSVAAKIMARYGFKDGQGLGKQEQGMSMALQVEKTSKRGGRIVHERDISLFPPPADIPTSSAAMAAAVAAAQTLPATEPSITEIMKSPSKVVLLRNMVGPGDVDDELEPEVKDECNTKYGDVVTVVIHEMPKVVPEETVRIFVEFKRMESAIKAVVDLNGRFFGGRQVRAGFYNQERFDNMDLIG